MKVGAALALALALQAQGPGPRKDPGPLASLSVVVGRPTDRTATLSVLSATNGEAYVTWGPRSDALTGRSPTLPLKAGLPSEFTLTGLPPDARSVYRVYLRPSGAAAFAPGPEGTVQTQRRPGSAFTFALQGDSHPERPGKMYSPELYARTLRNAAQDHPDFYVTLGDDFSIERLIARQALSQPAVDEVYAHQRGFLGLVGGSSALFLVNGNHEQAARYLLDGTETNPAVLAARARLRFYPLPVPDGFYTGDAEAVAPIGLLRDYYAWTWGDALFVVLDPYWHSPVAVDNHAGAQGPQRDDTGQPTEGRKGGKGRRDLWQVTLGDAQYHWLEDVLLRSKAKWKFVFAHHVHGTGRGGIEEARLYEWGGQDRRGEDAFKAHRSGWARPIHDLFVKAGVTIFFQGHDHLYARQELDGVIYQSTPNPGDPTGTAFNREAYRSGDVRPNSGHLRVTVGPDQVRVDYVQSALEGGATPNGTLAHTYSVSKK